MNLNISIRGVTCLVACTAAMIAPSATHRAAAEDFKVETTIYAGDKKEPTSQNITRFQAGIVWDFAGDGSEIVMFDKARGRFTLMDLRRQVKTNIATDDVLKFTQELRDWASQGDNPLLSFCAAPRLDKSAGATPETLIFSSPLLTYEVLTQRPDNPEVAKRYREFSDWYARVNTLFRPGVLPPFPRLLVNEHLGRDGVVPQRVQLTLAHSSRKLTVRSEQAFVYGLMQSDVDQINKAANQMAAFRAVELAQYRQVPPAK